jgi:hypothetical protein
MSTNGEQDKASLLWLDRIYRISWIFFCVSPFPDGREKAQSRPRAGKGVNPTITEG